MQNKRLHTRLPIRWLLQEDWEIAVFMIPVEPI